MIDSQLIFDGTLPTTGVGSPVTGVAITASATTQASTNVIDLLAARDLGADEPLGLHVFVTTTNASTTNSATLTIDFQVSSAAAGTYYSLLTTPLYAASQLIAGAPLFRYALPLNQLQNAVAGVLNAPGRYLRLLYTVGTGVFTNLSVFSYISPRQDRQEFTVYKNNYTVATTTSEI